MIWLDTMRGLIGTREIPGAASNPQILEFARFVGDRFPEMRGYSALYKNDDTAWCGLVLAYCMAKAGIRPPFGATDTSRFLWAYSWNKFGMKLDAPKIGAVLVLKRTGGYHVAICDGETATHFWVIGGNQSNQVSRILWPKGDLVGAYWPPMVAAQTITAPSPLISQAAFDLIVSEEITSKTVYEKKYRSPIWPGGASGITVGIGYDVGAGPSSLAELRGDWKGQIPDAMIDRLASGLRVTGPSAKNLLPMNDVDVPWSVALDVFSKVTLPKYYGMAARALPNFDKLSPDCKGALTSLVYNRGASFGMDGDRYREMRAIKAYMATEKFAMIPDEFRKMKRLWPSVEGLQKRREREALLFEKGLKSGGITITNVIVTTSIIVGGGNAMNEVSKPEPDYTWVAIVGFAAVAIVVVALILKRKFKKEKS